MTESTAPVEVSEPAAGRPPAPEPLELVRQFVNTTDVESGQEDLADAAAVKAWFADRGLLDASARVTAADHHRVIAFREALRALLLANNGVPLESGAVDAPQRGPAERTPLEARFDTTGTIGVTGRSAGVDGALGQILAVVVQAVADKTWTCLKACRDDECHWAFYDHSRNRSGQWCVMAVCGNRNKARTYRRRQRGS